MRAIGHKYRQGLSRSPNQLSLAALLLSFVYLAAYLAMLSSIPAIIDCVRVLAALPSARTWIASLAWLLLGLRYVRRKQVGAIATHFVPVALVAFFLGMTGDLGTDTTTAMILLTCSVAAIFSYPISLAKTIEVAIDRESQPGVYLGYNVLGASVAVAFICSLIPSLLRGRFYWEGAVFGGLAGCWLGLYQAVATSRRLGEMTVAGLPVKAAVTAGFWAGTVGTVVLWTLGLAGWNGIHIPGRFSPLLGVPVAIIVAHLCRSTKDRSSLRGSA